MKPTRGISLLEVLVVLAIIGILVAALSLSFGGSESRQLENGARQVRALIELACDRAGISGSDMGIRVSDDQLEFGFIDALGWHRLAADSADPLRPRALDKTIALSLRRDGRELNLHDDVNASSGPQLACLGSGELTRFELRIRAEAVDETWLLRGTASGRLSLERSDAAR